MQPSTFEERSAGSGGARWRRAARRQSMGQVSECRDRGPRPWCARARGASRRLARFDNASWVRRAASAARAAARGAQLRRDLDAYLGLRDVRIAQLRRGAAIASAREAAGQRVRPRSSRRCAAWATWSA